MKHLKSKTVHITFFNTCHFSSNSPSSYSPSTHVPNPQPASVPNWLKTSALTINRSFGNIWSYPRWALRCIGFRSVWCTCASPTPSCWSLIRTDSCGGSQARLEHSPRFHFESCSSWHVEPPTCLQTMPAQPVWGHGPAGERCGRPGACCKVSLSYGGLHREGCFRRATRRHVDDPRKIALAASTSLLLLGHALSRLSQKGGCPFLASRVKSWLIEVWYCENI